MMSRGGFMWDYKRGWSFVALVLSGGNALVLWYIGFGFDAWFDTIFAFALVFAPIVVIVSMVFGRWDTERGTYGGEIQRAYENNPFLQEMMRLLVEINEKLSEEND